MLRLSVASAVFVAVSSLTGLLLAWLEGGMTTMTSLPAMAAGFVAAALACLSASKETKDWRWPDWLLSLVFAWAAWRGFCWLIYEQGDLVMIGSAYNLGDLSMHLQMIQLLASGASVWPDSPIFAGEAMRYPMGMNWFNAQLASLGVPLVPGLVWTGLLATVALVVSLRQWGGSFALAAFLLAGGLSGFALLNPGGLMGNPADEMAWKNPFLSLWITQRGFYYALPAGLLLLASWRRRVENPSVPLFAFWIEVVIYATMPLFHFHTFLFLSLVLATLFATDWLTKGWGAALNSPWVALVVFAFLPASLLVWLVTGGLAAGGSIGWSPGWMPEGNSAYFWAMNFGLSLPLAAVAVILAVKEKNRLALGFLIPAAVLFLACCLWRFAPWPWDNIKLMLWSWLAVVPFIWALVLKRVELIPRILLCVVLFFSGAATLTTSLLSGQGFELARRSEWEAVRHALDSLPRDAVFAISPDYNHPVILSGRAVVVGYDGHLWSHGYDYQKNRAMLEVLLHGDPKAAGQLGADYLFLGSRELSRGKGGAIRLARYFRSVASGPGFQILQLPTNLEIVSEGNPE